VTKKELHQERGNSLRKNNSKILIADDDETVLHLLRKSFVERGFHVMTARDGFVAMDRRRLLPNESPHPCLLAGRPASSRLAHDLFLLVFSCCGQTGFLEA